MSKRKRKNDNSIRVRFIGSSCIGVTGSCVSISYIRDDLTKGLLFLDMGLPQGYSTTPLGQYNDMERMVNAIKREYMNKDYSNINMVLSHVHIDHLGLTPILNEDNGFNGKIYCSKNSRVLAKPMLEDCFKIHNSTVKYLKSRGKKKDLLYTSPQLYYSLSRFTDTPLNQEISIDNNCKIILRPNCHTIDSVNITVIIKKPNTNRFVKILYTGDVGNTTNYSLSNYLTKQEIETKYDLVISEATYSQKPEYKLTKKNIIEEMNNLKNRIETSIKDGRIVLMPNFSFSGSQQMITYLYQWFKDNEYFINNNINIVMDSNLMLKINDCYLKILESKDKDLFEKIMNWKLLKKINTYDGTVAFLTHKKPCIILSSSGFMENGKIECYLRSLICDSKCDIIVTRYCAKDCEGSMAWKLFNDKQKTITFNGNNKAERITVVKRCGLYNFYGFSGHASYYQLLDMFSKFNTKKILLHHMENSKKEDFIKDAKEYLRNKNKTTQITAVGKDCYEFKL